MLNEMQIITYKESVNNFIGMILNTILIGSYQRDIFNKITIKFEENKIINSMSIKSS
jgi:hypothetical protein